MHRGWRGDRGQRTDPGGPDADIGRDERGDAGDPNVPGAAVRDREDLGDPNGRRGAARDGEREDPADSDGCHEAGDVVPTRTYQRPADYYDMPKGAVLRYLDGQAYDLPLIDTTDRAQQIVMTTWP